MKKLKRLNVIEEGRICTPEELKEIVGGYTTCSGGIYASCTTNALTTCSKTGYTGYVSGPPECPSYVSCPVDYAYTSCNTSGKQTCSSNTKYQVFP